MHRAKKRRIESEKPKVPSLVQVEIPAFRPQKLPLLFSTLFKNLLYSRQLIPSLFETLSKQCAVQSSNNNGFNRPTASANKAKKTVASIVQMVSRPILPRS